MSSSRVGHVHFVIALDSCILEPFDNRLGLINGLGQLDSLLYRILLPYLIDRGTFIVRSFDVDHFIVCIAVYIVRADIYLG